MDDEILMGERDRGADLLKQIELCLNTERICTHIFGYRQSFDVLHYEIGQPFISCSAIDQLRDVRMPERGEYLPLIEKAFEDRIGIETVFDQLDRNAVRKLTISPLCQVNQAHAAGADLFDDLVFADHAADKASGFFDRRNRGKGRA